MTALEGGEPHRQKPMLGGGRDQETQQLGQGSGWPARWVVGGDPGQPAVQAGGLEDATRDMFKHPKSRL